MKFKHVEIKNFLSVGEASFGYENNGLVLVTGVNDDVEAFDSNGAGKSAALVEAILWCFYGETLRGEKGDAVINRTAKKGCRVRLTLEIDGDEVVVTRHRKYPKKRNLVEYSVAGDDKTASTNNDTQGRISELLGVSKEVFLHAVILGQGMAARFTDLTDLQRKSLLEEILGLFVYEQARQSATNQTHTSQRSVELLEVRVESSARALEAASLNLTQLEVEAEQLSGTAEAKGAKKDKEEANRLRADAEVAKAEASDARNTINGAWSKADIELKASREKERQMQASVVTAQAHVRGAEAALQKGEALAAQSQCVTCHQPILNENMEPILAELRQRLGDTQGALLTAQKVVDDTQMAAYIKKLEGECSMWQGKAARIVQLETEADARISEADRRIVAADTILTGVKERRASCKRLIEAKKQEIANHVEASATAKAEHTALQELVEYSKWWRDKGFVQLKSFALDAALSYINQRLSVYMHGLSDGELQVALSPTSTLKSGAVKEAIDIQVSTQGGSYRSASGGEARRIDIAVALALNDLCAHYSGFTANLMIADEVVDNLDASGVTRLVQVLEDRTRDLGTFFLVSHNTDLKAQIATTWTVQKRGGVSTVIANGGTA